MSPESKLVLLANQDAQMVARFGSPARICSVPLTQGMIPKTITGTWPGGGRSAIEFRRVSMTPMYSHDGRNPIERLYVQFNVRDFLLQSALDSADVLKTWLDERANFTTGEQFASPPTTPKYFANFQANQLTGTEPQSNPLVYIVVCDFWLYFNNQN